MRDAIGSAVNARAAGNAICTISRPSSSYLKTSLSKKNSKNFKDLWESSTEWKRRRRRNVRKVPDIVAENSHRSFLSFSNGRGIIFLGCSSQGWILQRLHLRLHNTRQCPGYAHAIEVPTKWRAGLDAEERCWSKTSIRSHPRLLRILNSLET